MSFIPDKSPRAGAMRTLHRRGRGRQERRDTGHQEPQVLSGDRAYPLTDGRLGEEWKVKQTRNTRKTGAVLTLCKDRTIHWNIKGRIFAKVVFEGCQRKEYNFETLRSQNLLQVGLSERPSRGGSKERERSYPQPRQQGCRKLCIFQTVVLGSVWAASQLGQEKGNNNPNVLLQEYLENQVKRDVNMQLKSKTPNLNVTYL